MEFLQSKNSFTFKRIFHEIVVIYLFYVTSSALSGTPTLPSENVTKENANRLHLGTVRYESALAAGLGTWFIADLVPIYLNVRAGESIKNWKSKLGCALLERFQKFCATSGIGNINIVWIKERSPRFGVRGKH
jgi:hypothetical protein